MPRSLVFIGLGVAAWFVALVVFAGVRATRRLKRQSADPLRLRRQLRQVWFALIWILVLPLTLLLLVATGYGVVALGVLIGYVFLSLCFMVLVQTILLPRARRRTGADGG